MKLFRAKQQQLRQLGARQMAPGNGKQPQLTPEQIAQEVAKQRMMIAAHQMQQRQAIATACLSGILSGIYSNPPENLKDAAAVGLMADGVVGDALIYADKLQARLLEDARKPFAAPPPAPAPDAPATPEAPPAANA